MYSYGDELGDRYSGFSSVSSFLISIGLNYEYFRILVLFLGVIFAAVLMGMTRQVGSRAPATQRLNAIAFLILIFMFVFEFYLIRLRAGLSIFFFTLAFVTWQSEIRFLFSRTIKATLTVSSAILSSAIHFETFVVLATFFVPALLWLRYVRIQSSANIRNYF